jgi:hypothetical protein
MAKARPNPGMVADEGQGLTPEERAALAALAGLEAERAGFPVSRAALAERMAQPGSGPDVVGAILASLEEKGLVLHERAGWTLRPRHRRFF